MKIRILNLLQDKRLDWLIEQNGFRNAKYSLNKMLEHLDLGGKLSFAQIQCLERIEFHIKLVDPHIETLTVNGEENVPVLFVTKLPEVTADSASKSAGDKPC